MSKKQSLLYGLVLFVLAVLVYMQFRTWRNFDWGIFLAKTGKVQLGHVLGGIGLTYVAYLMRALRWRIFLRPVKQTTSASLLAPTIIGFTGLALLGRPGEMIRPFLIARKEQLSFSSQLAVWTVERIFDIGGFALLLISAIFFSSDLKKLDYYGKFREGGFLLMALVAGLAVAAGIVSLKGERVARWAERRFTGQAQGLGHKLAARIREFRGGLNTIHGLSELAQLTLVSVAMWFLIALAYHEVTGAYGHDELNIQVAEVFELSSAPASSSVLARPTTVDFRWPIAT
jgi:glycosyltransferase 2 family protein